MPFECDWVFCHKNGDPFRTNLSAAVKNAAARVGVELPRQKAWHIFLRTWAWMMLQNGCDMETLRELGNWKYISMSLWYANSAGRDRKKEILNRIPTISPRQKKWQISAMRMEKNGQKRLKSAKMEV